MKEITYNFTIITLSHNSKEVQSKSMEIATYLQRKEKQNFRNY